MANSVSTGQFARVGAVSETIGSASRDSMINAGQEQGCLEGGLSRSVDSSPEPYAESMALRRRNPV